MRIDNANTGAARGNGNSFDRIARNEARQAERQERLDARQAAQQERQAARQERLEARQAARQERIAERQERLEARQAERPDRGGPTQPASDPIPVEPDGGIGDGAGPIPFPENPTGPIPFDGPTPIDPGFGGGVVFPPFITRPPTDLPTIINPDDPGFPAGISPFLTPQSPSQPVSDGPGPTPLPANRGQGAGPSAPSTSPIPFPEDPFGPIPFDGPTPIDPGFGGGIVFPPFISRFPGDRSE